jgi:hypothetical protein
VKKLVLVDETVDYSEQLIIWYTAFDLRIFEKELCANTEQ